MPPFMRTLLASAWSFFSFFTSEGVLQSQQQRTTSVSPSSIQESSPWYGETPLPDLFRISSSYSRDDDIYGHGIFGRDGCSDAFGPDAANSQCAPSMTLCCVRRNQAYPSCHQFLGKGWCCVGSNMTDNCYVDQPSACDEDNSVPCTILAEGTAQACCPRLTSCATNAVASTSLVRCNIQYGDLIRAAASSFPPASSSSSLSSSSTSSSISTSTPAGSTSTSSSTDAASASTSLSSTLSSTSTSTASPITTPVPGAGESPPSSTHNLSSGIIAGIATGSVAAAALVAGIVWYFLRLKKQKQQQHQKYYESQYAAAAIAAGVIYPHKTQHQETMGSYAKYNYRYGSPQEPVEIDSGRRDSESHHLYELAGVPSPRR